MPQWGQCSSIQACRGEKAGAGAEALLPGVQLFDLRLTSGMTLDSGYKGWQSSGGPSAV